jgi:hypothetical protein
MTKKLMEHTITIPFWLYLAMLADIVVNTIVLFVLP